MKSYVLAILFCIVCKGTAQTWPSCYVIGTDYSGDDVIAGLRFSEDECANWCLTVGPRYYSICIVSFSGVIQLGGPYPRCNQGGPTKVGVCESFITSLTI